MASSVTSPADVVNLSLRQMGYKLRVANLFDGSDAANSALDIYAETRDEMLRMADFDFTEKIAAAVVTGVAPAPWAVQYIYPTDCLKLRNLFNATYTADKNDPLPNQWTIGYTATNARVIWTNLASATLVYTCQVTDPTKWDPLFTGSLATELAKRLLPSLGSMEASALIEKDQSLILPLAVERKG